MEENYWRKKNIYKSIRVILHVCETWWNLDLDKGNKSKG